MQEIAFSGVGDTGRQIFLFRQFYNSTASLSTEIPTINTTNFGGEKNMSSEVFFLCYYLGLNPLI